jgi:hypothetical protein
LAAFGYTYSKIWENNQKEQKNDWREKIKKAGKPASLLAFLFGGASETQGGFHEVSSRSYGL